MKYVIILQSIDPR